MPLVRLKLWRHSKIKSAIAKLGKDEPVLWIAIFATRCWRKTQAVYCSLAAQNAQ